MAVYLRHVAGVDYFYEPKAVKNLNLRINAAGEVHLSAPRRTPVSRADAFVASKAAWILKARQRQLARLESREQSGQALPSPREALELFTRVSEQYYPLFAEVLGGQRPTLKVRDMTSRWGVCYPAKKAITLNLRLAVRPLPQVEYVVLHEYCHFVHPDHQAGFWALMESLMPDCKARRRALRD